ncbi:MFS transporter [Actinomadura macrotermitis]|uniref:Putative multidrug resistance protein MdtD n=1 Tax=Actinomadura macrotermitis TaxID=2585200 RepID=A0A7K0BM20_9ACTN|nr:MFS transporter [Actinomadura macrotermitis]MQY02227.1 putative multidrug resistance protein MdtD [Actinomadura macrotermitis]
MRSDRSHPLITLVVVLAAFITVPMSISGAAVALPGIGADLHAAGAPLQWVMNAYNLTFASFMLVAGSAADLLGRRRVFAGGAALFALGSLAAAAAPGAGLLDAARALSGVGAAGVFASGGAILATTFDGAARTRAFAALGSAAGLGLAAGPTLSGWLAGTLGWRASFGLHAAVLIVALTGTGFIAESRAARRPRLDVTGAVVFVAGLGALVLGAVQGPGWGWSNPGVAALLVAGVALLAAFTVLQARSAAPLLDLSLVRDRRFLALCLVPVVTTFGFVTLLTYLPTYLVGAGGLSAQRAGTVMLLMTAPVLAAPPLAGGLVNRGVPARAVITAALAMFAGGNTWLTVIGPDTPAAVIAGPLLLIGLGAGLTFGAGDGMAMSLVEPERAGMATGFLNTMRIGSEAIVIAVFGAVLVSLTATRVGSPGLAAKVAAGDLSGGDGAALAAGFTEALHLLLYGTAAVCAVGTVAIAAALAPPRRPAAAVATADETAVTAR